MLFEETINIAKVSPLLMFATVMGYLLTYEKTFIIISKFSGNTAINYIIKHAIMKPLMGNRKYPVIGRDLDQKEQKLVWFI